MPSDKEVEDLIQAALQEGVSEPIDEIDNFILETKICAGTCPVISTQIWVLYLKWLGDREPMPQRDFQIAFKRRFPKKSFTCNRMKGYRGFMLNEDTFGQTEDDKWLMYKQIREEREKRKKKTQHKV